MESGKEQNYWPGFVDALSNVVLTLVFVLVVFVFALMIASNKVEKRVKEIEQARAELQAAQEAPQASPPEQSQASAKLAEAKPQNSGSGSAPTGDPSDKHVRGATDQSAIVEGEDKTLAVDNQTPAPSNLGRISIARQGDKIIIGYPLSVSEIDKRTASDLGHALDAVKAKTTNKKVVLHSIIGNEPYTAARRLAYYRAITIRNKLIADGIADGSQITSILVQPDKPEDGRVEIIFENK